MIKITFNSMPEGIAKDTMKEKIIYILLTVSILIPAACGREYDEQKKIVFISNRDGNNRIYLMDEDGGNQQRISNGPGSDTEPSYSPDGNKIVFNKTDQVYLVNAEGEELNISNIAETHIMPTWSPNGNKIIFQRDFDGQLYSMNIDGNSKTQMSITGTAKTCSTWSPDGIRIAYLENNDIYIMNVDGSNPTQITSSATIYNCSWSPDGKQFVYEKSNEIYICAIDGSSIMNISNNVSIDRNPSWSPDGSEIVFDSDRSGNYQIYIMNADGSSVRRITNNAYTETSPCFQYKPR